MICQLTSWHNDFSFSFLRFFNILRQDRQDRKEHAFVLCNGFISIKITTKSMDDPESHHSLGGDGGEGAQTK